MIKLENKSIQLKIVLSKVVEGEEEKILKKNLVIKDINPDVSDEDLYKFVKDLVALQTLEVMEVQKVQNENVIEEEM